MRWLCLTVALFGFAYAPAMPSRAPGAPSGPSEGARNGAIGSLHRSPPARAPAALPVPGADAVELSGGSGGATPPSVPGTAPFGGVLPFAYQTTVTPTMNVTQRAQQYASHPIGGISWGFRWSDLERSPNTFDWSEVDDAIAAAASVHLPSLLRVISGPDSPSWVLTSVPTVQIPNKYFPNPAFYSNPTTLPVLWNAAYLADWKTFLTAFGHRYNGNSHVYVVAMTGPSLWGDMYLPPDVTVWNGAGYSDSALESAWQQVIGAYATAFSHTPVALGIAEPLICSAVSPGFVNPTCSAGYQSNVLTPVFNWVHNSFAHHVWLQQNNLKGSDLGKEFHLRRMIEEAANWTTVGYQMGGDASGAADLHNAFEAALQDHASYVEVYLGDIENPAYVSDFRYLRGG
jgi:hypothetical protein